MIEQSAGTDHNIKLALLVINWRGLKRGYPNIKFGTGTERTPILL